VSFILSVTDKPLFAECHYAACRYAERLGAKRSSLLRREKFYEIVPEMPLRLMGKNNYPVVTLIR
jgi:hypothetical protein